MISPDTAWEAATRPSRRVGRTIEAHASIGSTNDRARLLLDLPNGDGMVVVADEQTGGRGRRGRSWVSPPGVNLLVSVGLRPQLAASHAWQLGLAAAIGAADACASFGPVALKWPNDVVAADGAKVGGLLIETIVDGERLTGAIVGAGINVNWQRAEMPVEIRDQATSLCELAGMHLDRVALLDRLLDRVALEVEAVERGESPLERYRRRCVTIGSFVRVAASDRSIEGRAIDLDEIGALVIETADGPVHVTSGELVRLRPEPAR